MKKQIVFFVICLFCLNLNATDLDEIKKEIDYVVDSVPEYFNNNPLFGLYDLEIKMVQTPPYGPSQTTTINTKVVIKKPYYDDGSNYDFDYSSCCIDPSSETLYNNSNFLYYLMFHIYRLGKSDKYNFKMFSDRLRMGSKKVKIKDYNDFSFELDLSPEFISLVWGTYTGTDIKLFLDFTKVYPIIKH